MYVFQVKGNTVFKQYYVVPLGIVCVIRGTVCVCCHHMYICVSEHVFSECYLGWPVLNICMSICIQTGVSANSLLCLLQQYAQ